MLAKKTVLCEAVTFAKVAKTEGRFKEQYTEI